MHNNVIAVFDSHQNAVAAIQELLSNKLASKDISLLGKMDAEDISRTGQGVTEGKVVGSTTVLGATLGVLAGVGILAIPGIGFLYGAGALAGAIAGLDFGIIGGGIISAILLTNEKTEIASIYDDYLKNGKTLLIFRGNDAEIEKAKVILEGLKTASSVQAHKENE